MLAKNLMSSQIVGNRIVPVYIDMTDRIWIESLISLYERNVGQTRRDFRFSLMEFRNIEKLPNQKFEIVCKILDTLFKSETKQKNPSPQSIRREVFQIATGYQDRFLDNTTRQRIIEKASKKLKLAGKEIKHNLFSDLPNERLISPPKDTINADLVRLKANMAIVQSFLAQTDMIKIKILGQSRPIIRHAKWRGLICIIQNKPGDQIVDIDISGPLTILRKTLVYGKALGELVPFLGLSKKFELYWSSVNRTFHFKVFRNA